MYWFLGGDQRAYWTVQCLREAGYAVHTHGVPGFGEEPLPEVFPVLLLPFPSFQGDGLSGAPDLGPEALLPRLRQGSRVYGGRLSGCLEQMQACGATVTDLYDTEPLTTLNAIPTAEGALALAMEASSITIHGSHCLVIGAGRIGSLLARRLKDMGAEVTVAARSPGDRARIRAQDMTEEETGLYHKGLGQYEFLFNTVPARVLNREQLSRLRKDCVLLELASAPGGFEAEACKALGLQRICGTGLPGRFSPKTAGILYAKSIMEREELP